MRICRINPDLLCIIKKCKQSSLDNHMQLYLLWNYLISSLQFDVFFAECNTPIETVQNTSTELKDAMSNFKRACSVAGVTSSAKASLEECIDGLKQLIRTDDDEDALEVYHCIF